MLYHNDVLCFSSSFMGLKRREAAYPGQNLRSSVEV